MRVTLASERRWPYIRSAPTEPLPVRTPAFPAMRRAERGSALLLETVAKSSTVPAQRRRCAHSRFLNGTVGGVGRTRRSAAYQAARRAQWARGRSRVHWLKKSTRRCGLSSGESRCPAHGASGAFLRSIKKKRADSSLKSMRCGRSNPCENEWKSCNTEMAMT